MLASMPFWSKAGRLESHCWTKEAVPLLPRGNIGVWPWNQRAVMAGSLFYRPQLRVRHHLRLMSANDHPMGYARKDRSTSRAPHVRSALCQKYIRGGSGSDLPVAGTIAKSGTFSIFCWCSSKQTL